MKQMFENLKKDHNLNIQNHRECSLQRAISN